MSAARAVIVLILILAVVVAYNPRAREVVVQSLEMIRPAVVQFMDGSYAALRELIAGNNAKDHDSQETPLPSPGPSVNYERIVTVSSGFLF